MVLRGRSTRRPMARRPYAKRRGRKGLRLYRRMRALNPMPTFVETFHSQDSTFGDFQIPAGAGIGRVFKVRISDIPQFAQYATLYTQYRINWIKVIVIPDFNTLATEANASQYNSTIPTSYVGMGRVVHAIQDSPGQVAPANENIVLEDNGCKINPLRAKWMVSFKAVPDIELTSQATGNAVLTRQRFKSWYNFDSVTTGNNPPHGSVVSYWTLPGGGGGLLNCSVYYKVSFTLRDPQ